MDKRHDETAPRGPGPYLILNLQVDSPLPDLSFDDRYEGVMVVAWRGAVPAGTVTFDFGSLSGPIVDAVAHFMELVKKSAAKDVPALADSELPPISVVIPSIVERVADIELLINSLGELDYPNVEFVIVDNRRTVPEADKLPELVSVLGTARVVRAARPGISSARNTGVAAARNEIIVFTDDDVRVEKQWLRAIGTRFVREPDLDAVTGLILPAELETAAQIWFERYYGGFAGERLFAPATVRPALGRARALRNSRAHTVDANGVTTREFAIYGVGAFGAGANMSVRKSALKRIGGFNLLLGVGTPARGGEDLDVLIKLLWTGGAIGYESSAAVHHRHRLTYSELLHQLHGYGVGFTAILWSLVVNDPRHLVSIGSQLPRAVGAILNQSLKRMARSRKSAGGANSRDGATDTSPYPRELLTRELSGFPLGPFAYGKSIRVGKRWEKSAKPSV